MQKMTKTQYNNQTQLPKRISPELAEVLHMLKSIESQPDTKPVVATTRA
jgi:hypothetical protein